MPPGFPVCLRLAGRAVLVAGGGAVALRKARALAEAGASIRAVAPSFVGGFGELPDTSLTERRFRETDLDGVWFAVAATDDAAENRRIAACAEARGVWTNVAAPAEAGDVALPAVARSGPLAVAVSTDGASPALAARLRHELEATVLGPWGRAAAVAADLRAEAKERIADPAARRIALERLGADSFLQPALAGDLDAARRAFRDANDSKTPSQD
jgi:uroporphyrin-III C-methyltransferase/precorrin-2 dehydrogenase/sirohydrochlorin ferrochelatase